MMPETSNSLADILVAYARRGWPVLPIWGIVNGVCACPLGPRCKGPGKHPHAAHVPHGVKDATTHETIVRQWADLAPHANWAIATGHALVSGGYLVVLDVDPRNGGDDTLAALVREHGELPETARAVSGGNGAHYLFSSREPLASSVLGEGLDVKAAGGYVCVEPSVHYSGRSYAWDVGAHPDDTPIAELPPWLARRLVERGRERPTWTGLDAKNSLLGEAFELAGMLGDAIGEGKRIVRCPWEHEHSDERGRGLDSSAVLLPPTPDSNFGSYKCLHGHCQHRGWREVLAALPPHVVQQARAKWRPRPVASAEPAAPEAPSSASPTTPAPAVMPVEDWRTKLIWKRKKDGTAVLEKGIANVITILRFDPRWEGRITFDEFAQRVSVTSPPWHGDDAPSTSSSNEWTDEDDTRLVAWLHRAWSFEVPTSAVAQAVAVAARAHTYHPVRDYLQSLAWDGVRRIERLFVQYFGADDTPYVRGVGQRWMISAVARIMKPGCKADCLPVLEGGQGLRKSSALRALVGADWFSDSAIKIGSADGYAVLHGKWIIELAELDSLSRAEVSAVKQYLSAQDDHYRRAYGRHHRTYLRQCVFAGTTNEKEYNQDPSGARRFWPILCAAIDLAGLARDRDQLWAEAVALFEGGLPWWTDTEEFRALCEVEQEERYVGHPWEQPIADWLDVPTHRDRAVTTYEVMVGALHMRDDQMTKSAQITVAAILVRSGYIRGKKERVGSKIVRRYRRPPSIAA